MPTGEIKNIVREILLERDENLLSSRDEAIFTIVATILSSFGIYDEERKEMRADFQQLRRWRKSMEQAQSYTFKAVITLMVTGFVGAVLLGVKAMLGK
jgi:ABC-type transporter Mla maintaining outer membrane lipid asymmetry permease subunit MlaE